MMRVSKQDNVALGALGAMLEAELSMRRDNIVTISSGDSCNSRQFIQLSKLFFLVGCYRKKVRYRRLERVVAESLLIQPRQSQN